jgi:hypothetical protein
MKTIKAWPFLSLAAFTLVIGVVWHVSGVNRNSGAAGAAFYWFAAIIGSPFIGGMTLATRWVNGALRPLIGLVIGLAPYVIADLMWRRLAQGSRA